MRGHRRVIRVLLVAVLASGALFVGMGTAHACSCITPEVAILMDEADGAFVGELVSRPSPPIGSVYSSADLAPWVFEVQSAYKGEIISPITVMSALEGASCGFEMAEGQSLSIFVYRSGQGWDGSLCSTMDSAALAQSGIDPISFETEPDGSSTARWALLGLGLGAAGGFAWWRFRSRKTDSAG